MSKLLVLITLLNLTSAYALSPESSTVITSDQGVINGLSRSTKSYTFIKIGNSTESGLTLPAVAHRTKLLKDDATPHAVSFDERLYFYRLNPTTYVSKSPDSSCVATLKKVTADSFKVSVNSVELCFNQHSQFNIESALIDQTESVAPFKDVVFKLDTNSVDVKYFSSFE